MDFILLLYIFWHMFRRVLPPPSSSLLSLLPLSHIQTKFNFMARNMNVVVNRRLSLSLSFSHSRPHVFSYAPGIFFHAMCAWFHNSTRFIQPQDSIKAHSAAERYDWRMLMSCFLFILDEFQTCIGGRTLHNVRCTAHNDNVQFSISPALFLVKSLTCSAFVHGMLDCWCWNRLYSLHELSLSLSLARVIRKKMRYIYDITSIPIQYS